MNDTSATMTKLYKLRNSIRKLYTSVDTSYLKESIYKSLHRNYAASIESCTINLENYSITILCKPLTSVKTKNDIINTVMKKLKSFIVDNTEISLYMEEDLKMIKSSIDTSNAFVCDSYIMGETISFLL